MIFWHHLRLFLEDETPNGDFSIDDEHDQYAVGIDIVRLPNQGRREGDLFLTGHDVAPLDCYAGNNRVQMKIPRVLCADGICVFYAQFVVGIPCLRVMHACMAIWNISSSIFSRTHCFIPIFLPITLSLTSSFHITHPMHAPIAIKPIVSYPFSFPSPFLSLARSISPNRMEFGLLTMHHYYYYYYWTWA